MLFLAERGNVGQWEMDKKKSFFCKTEKWKPKKKWFFKKTDKKKRFFIKTDKKSGLSSKPIKKAFFRKNR